MKNKGCLIAGCAGLAIAAVVVVVLGVAGWLYMSSGSKAKEKRESYTPAAADSVPKLPSGIALDDAKKVQMVHVTLVGFQAAIREGTFRGLYDAYVSDLWKRELTPAQL